jgi:hypothetical protein
MRAEREGSAWFKKSDYKQGPLSWFSEEWPERRRKIWSN